MAKCGMTALLAVVAILLSAAHNASAQDLTRPKFISGYPQATATSSSSISVVARIDEPGTIWCVSQPDGNPAPSGSAVRSKGLQRAAATSNTDVSFSLTTATGVLPSSLNAVYCYAEDDEPVPNYSLDIEVSNTYQRVSLPVEPQSGTDTENITLMVVLVFVVVALAIGAAAFAAAYFWKRSKTETTTIHAAGARFHATPSGRRNRVAPAPAAAATPQHDHSASTRSMDKYAVDGAAAAADEEEETRPIMNESSRAPPVWGGDAATADGQQTDAADVAAAV